MPPEFDLNRFVVAQAPAMTAVRQELVAGKKETHWMWFVFPQIAGLGSSQMAQRYALASREEARAFMTHPILGPRLVDCTNLVAAARTRTVRQIFGTPDDLKFHSSMTIFALTAPGDGPFQNALDTRFGGQGDARTLALMQTD